MATNRIANAEDFRRAIEGSSVERVTLPASKLTVLLCRPPVFAAIRMGREGTILQNKITEVNPEAVKPQDILAFGEWITETLTRLFVQPRFSAAPKKGEIGLLDIMVDDLKFIFGWLRGEVFSAVTSEQETANSENPVDCPLPADNCTEDLGRFSGRPGAAALLGGSRETQPVPAERAAGTAGNAGLSAGLRRG